MSRHLPLMLLIALIALPAMAGPPYFNDDPVPTDEGHFETYLFTAGAHDAQGRSGAAGIDFNYGGAKDLQLTAALPLERDAPYGGARHQGIGTVELAAKYRVLLQDEAGVDVAFFPRVFLPSPSRAVGERHASLLLPVWIGHSGESWSHFGGGGCALHRGGDAKDYCQIGWALTRQLTHRLQVGAEVYHRTADTQGGDASTGVGFGFTADLAEHLHLMTSATNRSSWYAALQLTY